MEKRSLGRSGLQVAPLAFGGNVFGWTADEKMSFQLLDAFLDAGFNLVDTADVYSRWVPGHKGGESETIIGAWMKARNNRGKVLVATKAGMEMGPKEKGLSAAYLTRAVDASLKRLQTDYIDLYQAHTDDADTPLEETLAAFAKLIQAGKVRAIGASNYSAARLTEALRISERLSLPRYESLQPPYNLYDRADFEDALQPLVVKEQVGVIPYFPLAAGFLTGKYRTAADFGKSPRGGGMGKYLNDRGLRILAGLDDVAARHGATLAQVALAWLLAKPGVTAPIASATSPAQFADLAKAATLRLDQAALAQLDTASGKA